MRNEIRDPEYEKMVERAFALLGTVVLGTIFFCIWKITHTLIVY